MKLPEKMTSPISLEFIKQARKKSALQLLHETNREALSPRKDEPKKSPTLQINTNKTFLKNFATPGIISTPINNCKCTQVINNGLNLIISTPLIIRWSLDNKSSCYSVQKIMWTYKSSYVLSVDISMDKTNFKKDEIIEFELTVKNNTFEEMDLVCLMIDECIENNYKRVNGEKLCLVYKKFNSLMLQLIIYKRNLLLILCLLL